jgi:hypothetical protein|tara:strand:- start:1019 stop:1414 length:396 start_codon:yes stop_codon:yes gene_type:complete
MKKIFIILTSMFLLVSCIEPLTLIGGGAANGKLTQSALQTTISYGVKKKTGRTPLGHAFSYAKKSKKPKKKNSCSSFLDKKALEVCLMVEKRIISKQAKIKEKESYNKPLKEITSSLQFSINEKSKIKYLD